MKKCLICEKTKPETEFSVLKTGRGGLHPWCRPCLREYHRARRDNREPEKRKHSFVVTPREMKLLESRSGVYEILDTTSGRAYIGASRNLRTRMRQHLTDLRGGYHHCKALQARWDEVGEHSFQMIVRCLCAPNDLDAFERTAWGLRKHQESGFNDAHYFRMGGLERIE